VASKAAAEARPLNVLALSFVVLAMATGTLQPPSQDALPSSEQPQEQVRNEDEITTDNHRPAQDTASLRPVGITPDGQVEACDSRHDHTDKAMSNRWRTDQWMLIFNGILAAVAVLTLFVLHRQTNLADGASQQTQRLERPWVSIEVGQHVGIKQLDDMRIDPTWPDRIPDNSTFQMALHVVLRNGGRTVARIREGALSLELWDVRTGLPSPPDQWEKWPLAEVLISPGGTFDRYASRVLNRDELRAVLTGTPLMLKCSVLYEGPIPIEPMPRSSLCMVSATAYDAHEREWRTVFNFFSRGTFLTPGTYTSATYNHYT
jgi:hypothetical protein